MSDPTPARRPSAPSAPASSSASRRQLVLLAALMAVLGSLVMFVVLPAVWGGGAASPPAGQPPIAQNAQNPAPQPGKPGAARPAVVDVRLDRLAATAAEPAEGGRNPFRMGAAPPPPGQSQATAPPTGPSVAAPPVATGPPPPPPVPPIPLKFIGIVTGGGRTGKIAVLSDGKEVFSGKEQDVVDGRYRIVRIGEESIQIEHADGRGRQTLRLSGQ